MRNFTRTHVDVAYTSPSEIRLACNVSVTRHRDHESGIDEEESLMADATVNIKVTGMEPFAQFIGKAAQANDAFRSLSAEEAKALPAKAAEGIAKLQSALRALAGEPAAPIYEAAVIAQIVALRRAEAFRRVGRGG
jgi:hypothetical protein